MSRIYKKLHTSSRDRVEHLRSKGLIIRQPNVAAKKIEQIGYERLRIYFLSRQSLTNKTFRSGTSYQDIIEIYECDAKLRSICFEAVGRFEVAFRNSMSETLSSRGGSHPYEDMSLFQSAKKQAEACQQLIRVALKSTDRRAHHYYDTYDAPALPPIWMIKEFLTFGESARFFECLENNVQQTIATSFGVRHLLLFKSWVKCFVDLRNITAHHDRLFNRHFQKQPMIFQNGNVPTAPQNSLKALLEILDFSLRGNGQKSNVTTHVSKIINRCHAISPAEAGF